MQHLPFTARLASLWQAVRESYWFVPSLMALGAVVAALALLELDQRAPRAWAESVPWLYESDPQGARAVLSVVAGSMITVTGLVFSITIVALTLASSQFGPRLLRSFMRDRANQVTMGTFVATFLFCLLVLRAVHLGGDDASVPHVSVAVAVAFSLASLFVLIYFIHHAARSIQAANVISAVADELDDSLDRLHPAEGGDAAAPHGAVVLEAADEHALLERLEGGQAVVSRRSGYVRVVALDRLTHLAREHDVMLGLERGPGDFVGPGDVVARVHAGGEALADEDLEGIGSGLLDCYALGSERTAVQDLSFLAGQLTEMAVRALSPGVNDPHTAIACTHRLGSVLTRLGERPLPPRYLADETGALRVVRVARAFDDIVFDLFGPLRRYAAGDAEVVLAVLGALRDAAGRASDSARREVLVREAREVEQAFLRSEPVESERARIARAVAAAHDAAGLPRGVPG